MGDMSLLPNRDEPSPRQPHTAACGDSPSTPAAESLDNMLSAAFSKLRLRNDDSYHRGDSGIDQLFQGTAQDEETPAIPAQPEIVSHGDAGSGDELSEDQMLPVAIFQMYLAKAHKHSYGAFPQSDTRYDDESPGALQKRQINNDPGSPLTPCQEILMKQPTHNCYKCNLGGKSISILTRARYLGCTMPQAKDGEVWEWKTKWEMRFKHYWALEKSSPELLPMLTRSFRSDKRTIFEAIVQNRSGLKHGPCKTFTKFPKLPGELRAKIIEAAMNRPRLMRSQVTKARLEHPGSQSAEPHTMGPLYYVSREVRAEALKHINLAVPTVNGYCTYPWTYINPLYDVVLCQDRFTIRYDNEWKWDEIPTENEAPGLQRIALPLVGPIDCPASESQIKDSIEVLAPQIHGLPDLREVLIVRPLPYWTDSFLYWTLDKTDSYNAERIEFVVNDCGFFWNVNEDIERLIEKSQKYLDGNKKETVEDEVDYLVKSFIEEMDDDLFCIGSLKTSGEILELVQGFMKDVYERKYPGVKMPKFTVVYMQSKVQYFFDSNEWSRTIESYSG